MSARSSIRWSFSQPSRCENACSVALNRLEKAANRSRSATLFWPRRVGSTCGASRPRSQAPFSVASARIPAASTSSAMARTNKKPPIAPKAGPGRSGDGLGAWATDPPGSVLSVRTLPWAPKLATSFSLSPGRAAVTYSSRQVWRSSAATRA